MEILSSVFCSFSLSRVFNSPCHDQFRSTLRETLSFVHYLEWHTNTLHKMLTSFYSSLTQTPYLVDWSPPRLYTKCPPVFSMAKSRYNDVSIVRVRVRVWVKDGVSQQGVSDQLTMEQMTHRNNTPHVPGE